MPASIPSSGQVRVRVLQVNSLTRGEVVHDVKARLLPREDGVKPIQVSIRDEICPKPPMAGDRLKLTMQAGTVAGVELLKPKKTAEKDD